MTVCEECGGTDHVRQQHEISETVNGFSPVTSPEWIEISLSPEEWQAGDRFTIAELREPTVARQDEYNNLVVGNHYVRRGEPWAAACDVLKAERFMVQPAKLTAEGSDDLESHIALVEEILGFRSDVPWPSLAKLIEAARKTETSDEVDIEKLIEENQAREIWTCAQCGKESGMYGHGGRCIPKQTNVGEPLPKAKKYPLISMPDAEFDRIVFESTARLLEYPEEGRTQWFKEFIADNPDFIATFAAKQADHNAGLIAEAREEAPSPAPNDYAYNLIVRLADALEAKSLPAQTVGTEKLSPAAEKLKLSRALGLAFAIPKIEVEVPVNMCPDDDVVGEPRPMQTVWATDVSAMADALIAEGFTSQSPDVAELTAKLAELQGSIEKIKAQAAYDALIKASANTGETPVANWLKFHAQGYLLPEEKEKNND